MASNFCSNDYFLGVLVLSAEVFGLLLYESRQKYLVVLPGSADNGRWTGNL